MSDEARELALKIRHECMIDTSQSEIPKMVWDIDIAASIVDAAFARIREEAVQKTAETAVHEILCNWMAHDEDDPGDARYVEHHTKHLVPTIVAAARVAILGTGDKL